MKEKLAFTLVLIIQLMCAVFFLTEILASLMGVQKPPISWALYELMEVGATLGLVLGAVVTSIWLVRSVRARKRAEESLRLASVAFLDMLEERFTLWGLTPAERDVALFAIKGLSLAEIAMLRNTSEGTVKAQTNAIYRKAGVSGRPQLLSLFIEDLLDIPVAAPRPQPNLAKLHV